MDKYSFSRRARRISVILAALGATAWATKVRSADMTEPFTPKDANDEAGYRKAIRDGVAEYDAGHFEEARSLFRRAHEMNPNARTFRGIGMASFELRDYVVAVHNLSAALQDKHKPLSAEQRKETQELLDRARMFVDVYVMKVVPMTARMLVDGHAPEYEADGTLLFGFGAHAVEASAPGMTTLAQTINVRGGARKELLLSLERAPPADAHLKAMDPTEKVMQKAPSPGPSNGAATAWLWASAGAALLAGGAGVYLYEQNSELGSCRNHPVGLRCTDEGALTTQRNVALATTIGTGAAALTMALIGIFTWKSAAPSAQHHSNLACIAGPFSITCGKAF